MMLLAVFIAVTSGLMIAAVIDRLRVRPVRLIWHDRTSVRRHVWVVAALVGLVGAIGYAGMYQDSKYLYLGLGYLIGSICWGMAMRLSSATLVTDFALIRNASCAGNVMTWSQVVDFFVRRDNNELYYIFLYLDADGRRARFEVSVPKACRDVFECMVYRYVERDKMKVPEKAYG